jgi:hypothetical protein
VAAALLAGAVMIVPGPRDAASHVFAGSDAAPETVATVEAVPNALQVYPRRAGARADDVEVRLGEAVEIPGFAVVRLESVERVRALSPHSDDSLFAEEAAEAATDESAARSAPDARAFVPKGVDDRSEGVRVRLAIDQDATASSELEATGTTSYGVSFAPELWELDCSVSAVADGRTWLAHRVERSGGQATVVFAVGAASGPFDLRCELSPLGGFYESASIVWRIDA